MNDELKNLNRYAWLSERGRFDHETIFNKIHSEIKKIKKCDLEPVTIYLGRNEYKELKEYCLNWSLCDPKSRAILDPFILDPFKFYGMDVFEVNKENHIDIKALNSIGINDHNGGI